MALLVGHFTDGPRNLVSITDTNAEKAITVGSHVAARELAKQLLVIADFAEAEERERLASRERLEQLKNGGAR